MRFVLPILLVLGSQAYAQQCCNLSVTQEEAQVLLNHIAEGKWKDVNSLMQKLIAQINSQVKPPAPPPPSEAPK